jgi:hypothetical protein
MKGRDHYASKVAVAAGDPEGKGAVILSVISHVIEAVAPRT